MSETPNAIYIHPAKQRVGFPFDAPHLSYLPTYPLLPVGVIGLVNMLRQQGISVRGVNYPMECFIDPTFDLQEWLTDTGRPQFVLVDLHWYEHSFGALDVARTCKQIFPNVPVVMGGMTASLYADEILEGFPWVDFIVRGDSEQPLRKLARYLISAEDGINLTAIPNLSYRVGYDVVENELSYSAEPSDLDELNFTDIDFLHHPKRYRGFQFVGRRDVFIPSEEPQLLGHWLSIGRGCRFDCSFCGGGRKSHQLISGRCGFTMRSTDKIMADIAELRKQGVQQVALSLDPAVVGKAYWTELFEKLSEQQNRIGIYNEAFQLPPPDFVEAFAQCVHRRSSGIALSVLSGDEQVRKKNGKFFSNHDLFSRLRLLRRYNLPVFIYFSLNLPGESEQSFRKTLFLARRIASSYPPHLLYMYNQPHTVDPCSPMSREPGEFGIQLDFESFSDYYDYCRDTAVETRGMTKNRGFGWSAYGPEDQKAIYREWAGFASTQRFPCS